MKLIDLATDLQLFGRPLAGLWIQAVSIDLQEFCLSSDAELAMTFVDEGLSLHGTLIS